MPTFSIEGFKRSVVRRGGFSRGHLFTMAIVDASLLFDETTSYYCRSTQLPAYTIETAPISCMSMTTQIPGRRTYDPITVTFYNTNNYELYHRFVKWQTGIRTEDRGIRNTVSVEQYLATIELVHYNEKGDSLEMYRLLEAYPTMIAGLSFSQDNETEFQTFDVTFAYSYFEMQDLMQKKADAVREAMKNIVDRPPDLPAGSVPGIQPNISAPPFIDGSFNPKVYQRINFSAK